MKPTIHKVHFLPAVAPCQDRTAPNPNWIEPADGDVVAQGFDHYGPFQDFYDASNGNVIRHYADGHSIVLNCEP